MLDESLHYVMDLDLFLRIDAIRNAGLHRRAMAAMTTHPMAKTMHDRAKMARERWRVRIAQRARRRSRCYEPAKPPRESIMLLPTRISSVADRLRGI